MPTPETTARRTATLFIFITVLLDTVAGGLAYPVLPKLVSDLSGGDAARVAQIFGAFGTMFFLIQFFAAPFQGALSDRYGRRPVILISNFGLGADYVMMALAPTLPWLFAGRVISGAAAGSGAAAYAYMIDITPQEQRTRMFSLLGAASSAGFALGPALGGLIGSYDLRAPFWIAALLSVLNGLGGLLLLPESLSKDRRTPRFSWAAANPVGLTFSLLTRYPMLLWWGLAIAVYVIAVMGPNSIFSVYLAYRFDWSPRNIGFYLATLGVWSMVTNGLIIPFLTKFLRDRAAIAVGGFSWAVLITLMGLVPSGVGYVALALVWALSTQINGTSFNSMLTREVSDSDQGQLQGAARSLNSIVGLAAPAVSAVLLAWGIRTGGKPLSGLPFVASGVLVVIGTAITLRVTRPRLQTSP